MITHEELIAYATVGLFVIAFITLLDNRKR